MSITTAAHHTKATVADMITAFTEVADGYRRGWTSLVAEDVVTELKDMPDHIICEYWMIDDIIVECAYSDPYFCGPARDELQTIVNQLEAVANRTHAESNKQ